jgi:hypothetical protein
VASNLRLHDRWELGRQTGSSGEWLFEEYLRQACAAVIDIP